MKSLKNTCLTFLLLIAQVHLGQAQEAHKFSYMIDSESKLWFEGTSTLHGYKCEAKKVNGSFLLKKMLSDSTLSVLNDAQVEGIVKIPVLGIYSGKDKMDKKMWKLLQASDHPEIVYEVTDLQVIDSSESAHGRIQLSIKGKITVAGVTKEIYSTVSGALQPDGVFRIAGEKPLLMSDFNIKPPTMFLGTLKTGDKITVFFEFLLKPAAH